MNEELRRIQTGTNIQEKANLIWSIADALRGLYKPHEYGEVILPMTVIKRFHDTLLPTRDKVLETYEKVKHLEVKDGFLQKASGYVFYNISNFTFENLLSDPNNIEENFLAFLHGFSENVQDVLKNFDFEREITKLANNDKLFFIIQEFNADKAYMGPDKITSTDMGYIFEELIKKFSESYDEEAGSHFTSRDIIYLMTDLLIAEEKDVLIDEGVAKTVYDQTMGTSQMLSAMEERLKALDAEAEVTTFGQEINEQTYAIAKADTMIRGGNPENMKLGNTLTNDQFEGYTFDYCISNPPFGTDWKSEYNKVKEEHDKGENGRFGVGLPKKNDGQLLFLLNGLSKLKNTGRMAIIHNGSALFSGAAGSGESEIRRYVIENDWLEAIIQLPNDAFYNTGISTYIWLLTKNKPKHRIGKVQLIDASNMYEKRRKNIGSKRVDITESCREMIVKAYGEFKNKEYTLDDKTVESKIFDNIDFGFYKVTVETPKYDEVGNLKLNKGKPTPDSNKRDTEDIPLKEVISDYFEKEIKPFNPDSWIDESKTKIGYEIPFNQYFYDFELPESLDDITLRIKQLEEEIIKSFEALSGKEVKVNE
ncbi:type I restriction-modification system subunit M [Priestia flexa]|uniref:type I restriction-modification system subunit M n=1 Tax=Priestia flexa TaxID=86664 RepID=UPI0003329CB6|nr:class I SAM-dependent DNA methyltransferase [Priestia flexa]AQX53040.1 restriction endonuclease subunit M [Priestia flexa]EOR25773.1 N-6 DNA methylase [Niallia nealsonii AAU1]